MDALTLGHLGEKYIFDLFKRAGRNPIYGGPGDIRLDGGHGLALEVKASLPGRCGRRRFQFCLYRESDGLVKTDAARSDLVILLAYRDAGSQPALFAIPRARLNGSKTLKLPADLGKYQGKWSFFAGFKRAIREIA